MIVEGINALVGFVGTFFQSLGTTVEWLLDGILFVLKGALYFAYDGVLVVIAGMFLAIDFTSYLASTAAIWVGIPSQLVYVLNQVSIPAGLLIIGTATGIRMIINLIPAAFTRI